MGKFYRMKDMVFRNTTIKIMPIIMDQWETIFFIFHMLLYLGQIILGKIR